MAKDLVEMTAEIVTAQASHVRMSVDELSDTLEKVFEALKKIKEAEAGALVEQVTSEGEGKLIEELRAKPLSSIQRKKVICLECGVEFRQLSKKHLSSHSLTVKEYKKKYKIPARQSLAAKALTTKRRKIAMQHGLGKKLAAYRKKQQLNR